MTLRRLESDPPLSGQGRPNPKEQPGDRALDHELLRRILRDRDEAAFADLVGRYSERAYWVAWHVVGNAEEARDIVQEAFVRVHRSVDRFDFAHSFTTWFYRIITNLAIDAVRRRKVVQLFPIDTCRDFEAGDGDPVEPLERDETRGRVWQVLDYLDPKFRAVLVLRDIHGMSCREIAPVLELTHATARWRLHRGRQLFREQWARLERADGGTRGQGEAGEEEFA